MVHSMPFIDDGTGLWSVTLENLTDDESICEISPPDDAKHQLPTGLPSGSPPAKTKRKALREMHRKKCEKQLGLFNMRGNITRAVIGQ
jgi:hypothetical protein